MLCVAQPNILGVQRTSQTYMRLSTDLSWPRHPAKLGYWSSPLPLLSGYWRCGAKRKNGVSSTHATMTVVGGTSPLLCLPHRAHNLIICPSEPGIHIYSCLYIYICRVIQRFSCIQVVIYIFFFFTSTDFFTLFLS